MHSMNHYFQCSSYFFVFRTQRNHRRNQKPLILKSNRVVSENWIVYTHKKINLNQRLNHKYTPHTRTQ